MHTHTHTYTVKNDEKYLQMRHISYFELYGHFRCFTGPLFQIKLHLLSTVLLGGSQSSLAALKSTE